MADSVGLECVGYKCLVVLLQILIVIDWTTHLSELLLGFDVVTCSALGFLFHDIWQC